MKFEEFDETCALLDWFGYKYPGKMIFHIPNEGKRNPRVAKKLGLLKGAPDLFIPEPVADYHGLFVEMKRTRKPNKPSIYQVEVKNKLIERRYSAHIAFGLDEAIYIISDYFKS